MNQVLCISRYVNHYVSDNKILRALVLTVIGVILLSVLSQLKIYLPFTPIPLTGQTLGVLLIGFLYGRQYSLMTLLAYVSLGSLGVPVFANASVGLLFSASGGYLVGFVFAALLCGYFAEKNVQSSVWKMVLVMIVAEALIYGFGLLQLSYFMPHHSLASLANMGITPFLVGDVIKMLVVLGFFSLLSVLKKK